LYPSFSCEILERIFPVLKTETGDEEEKRHVECIDHITYSGEIFQSGVEQDYQHDANPFGYVNGIYALVACDCWNCHVAFDITRLKVLLLHRSMLICKMKAKTAVAMINSVV